jgi:glucose-6-phosphate dehydrogenase assembly protein OpcA
VADPVAPASAPTEATPGMPAVMASWSGSGVSIGDVDDALLELRKGERRAATRVSTINLVVVAEDDASAERARMAMLRLGGRNPGRTIILIPNPAAPANVDADVHLHQAKLGSRPVWWEEVRIVVDGPVSYHLDSLVEPLTLGDLPVSVWYASSIPDPAEPRVGAADVVVVDSPAEMPDEAGPGSARPRDPSADGLGAFSTLLDLAQRRPVADLSWIRLTPWRRLLAALFDVGEFREYADTVETAEVAGRPGSALLLSGWLADRLELPRSAVTRVADHDAAMRLTSPGARGTGRFSVVRGEGEDHLVATAEIDGGARRQEGMALPDDPLAAALVQALTSHGHDRIYESAVGAAMDPTR